MSIPIYRADGHVVGVVEGRVFRQNRKPEHLLRTPPAIALDVCAVEAAQSVGADVLEVTVDQTGTVYTTSLSAFWSYGFRLDRGHGQQLALPLSAFFVVTASQPALPGTDWLSAFTGSDGA